MAELGCIHDLRRGAIVALGQIGEVAVEPLIAKLGDRHTYVRTAAVEALGRIGDPRAVAPLIAKLEDSNEQVRRYAAKALANTAALASKNVGVVVAEYDSVGAGVHPIVVLHRYDQEFPWAHGCP